MQVQGKGRVVLVLGGVRSGKSRFAQGLAERSAMHGASVTFVATAERRDDPEMTAKIDRHIAERPAHWRTVEETRQLDVEVRAATSDIVLIDCLTLFAANILEEAGSSLRIQALCRVLADSQLQVILVSNEVGSGVVPAYASGRQFRDLVGEMNQKVAAVADVVVYMIAGLPLALKGSLADIEVPL